MEIERNLRWSVGSVVIERVEENIVTLPTKVLVPDVTDEHLDRHGDWVAPYFAEPVDGEITLLLSLHSFVVRSGETTIVVDTCVGPDPERSLTGDPTFADRLDRDIDGGLAAVDVVVCTHVHFDHVGWNTITVDGAVVPTFPNARYLVTAEEMAELQADDHMDVLEPSIQPLFDAGVLDVIELESASPSESAFESGFERSFPITDEVWLIATPGHTAGHVSVLIQSDGAAALITGDAFHTPLQFAHPELAAWRFDTDSEQSTATRRSLVDRFVETGTLMLGTHFAPPTGGVLLRRTDGVEPAAEGSEGTVWFSPTADVDRAQPPG